MFKNKHSVGQRKSSESDIIPLRIQYGVVKPERFDNSDLWQVPTAEYYAWNIPDIILNILTLDGPRMSYDQIYDKLNILGVPTYTGYTTLAINELAKCELVVRVRRGSSVTVSIIERQYEDC